MLRDSHAARSDRPRRPDILRQRLPQSRDQLAAETPIGVQYLREIVREQPQLILRLTVEVIDPRIVRQMKADGLHVLEISSVEMGADPPAGRHGPHFSVVWEGEGI
jgi:hypothetical protein